MALLCIPVSELVSCTFSTIPICPFLILRIFHYRDGGGGLALSVYIRKLSFSPSISGQMDSYLHHCDYTIKATIGYKMGSF